jgi:hypothetical protein
MENGQPNPLVYKRYSGRDGKYKTYSYFYLFDLPKGAGRDNNIELIQGGRVYTIPLMIEHLGLDNVKSGLANDNLNLNQDHREMVNRLSNAKPIMVVQGK